MKATKRDFLRVYCALEALCGYGPSYDDERRKWRPSSEWLRDWRGVPHGQVVRAVDELVAWLDLRFPAGVPGQEKGAKRVGKAE